MTASVNESISSERGYAMSRNEVLVEGFARGSLELTVSVNEPVVDHPRPRPLYLPGD